MSFVPGHLGFKLIIKLEGANDLGQKILVLLGPVYTKRQRQPCDDQCDSVLIENNGVAPDWVCNPFSSDSTVFNENRTTLMLTLGVNAS